MSLTFLGSIAAATILTAPATISTASLAIHGIGFVALGTTLATMRLKENRHINALLPVTAGILTAQKCFLGAWGYAAMAGIAGVRSMVMAALPDNKKWKKKRDKIALGFAAVGIITVGMTGLFLSPWNFLPMASMLMGTAASAMISKESHNARKLYFLANINNGIYSFFFSGSGGATLIDGVAATNVASAIQKHDIPAADPKGKKHTAIKRAALSILSFFRKTPFLGMSHNIYLEHVQNKHQSTAIALVQAPYENTTDFSFSVQGEFNQPEQSGERQNHSTPDLIQNSDQSEKHRKP